MRILLIALPICLLVPAAAPAQDKAPAGAAEKPRDQSRNAFNKSAYRFVKTTLLRSAEKMPEESYGFKPTEAVRSFGQLIGHVADAQYMFCSAVLGEKNPAPRIEKTKSSKAELVASLKSAFAYCDKAYEGLTDASASETVKLFMDDMPKIDVLTANAMHSVEHYGNVVTYLRLKDIVPPSSEPGFMAEMRK